MATRGIQFLAAQRIPHQVVRYAHEEKGAAFAAAATGFPLERTIKTLVVALDSGGYALALMPGDRQLSMKKLAAVWGAKRASMADNATAERLTGYQVGGISPFGCKKRLPVVMETVLKHQPEVMINAGKRGVMVKLCPAHIIASLGARVADLCQ